MPAAKSLSARIFRCIGMLDDAVDDRHLERAAHARDGFPPIAAVDDDFGDHRVVVRRHGAFRVRERFDTDARAARDAERVDDARRRHEGVRIFRIDAALDRMAGERDVACLNESRSPAAMRICSLTMSTPVTISVTGCSTWSRVFASMK